jgi:vacuole morphology and inheritance protein 14
MGIKFFGRFRDETRETTSARLVVVTAHTTRSARASPRKRARSAGSPSRERATAALAAAAVERHGRGAVPGASPSSHHADTAPPRPIHHSTPIQHSSRRVVVVVISRASSIHPSLPALLLPSPRPQSALRNLSDKLYEKRKHAALEVEQRTRLIVEANDPSRLDALVRLLVNKYAKSASANHRKGGLIGLAAMTVGLASASDAASSKRALDAIVPPVLTALTDFDDRVRYYACEALYNIAKATRERFLRYLNPVFTELCKLSADADANVQNAASLLDRLLKDIVAESGEFDLRDFAPLIVERIGSVNPHVRTFLIGWITTLDSVPDIDVLAHVPMFLDGLLKMLSDPNREIRTRADAALSEFLLEARAGGDRWARGADVGALVRTLTRRTKSADEHTRTTALTWLRELVHLTGGVGPGSEGGGGGGGGGGARTGGGGGLIPHFEDVLSAVTPCCSHAEPRVRELAVETSSALLTATVAALKLAPEASAGARLNVKGVSRALLGAVGAGAGVRTRLEALRWYRTLLRTSPGVFRGMIVERDDGDGDGDGDDGGDATLETLLASLSHEDDDVVRGATEVVAGVGGGDGKDFDRVVTALVRRFAADRASRSRAEGREGEGEGEGEGGGEGEGVAGPEGSERREEGDDLLTRRGATVIRRLSAELGAERVFTKTSSVVVAAASTGEPSALAFAAAMTEALNVILLTSPECAKMRATLGGDDGDDAAKALFAALYPCWCHGAVATVALCLLCVADAHAAAVVTSLCDHESEITLRALVQIDQLVKLIESPVFARLRMRLLTPRAHPGAAKCLYALLMVLPQSGAFRTLKGRLDAVPAVARGGEGGGGGLYGGLDARAGELMGEFRRVRALHVRAAESRRLREMKR